MTEQPYTQPTPPPPPRRSGATTAILIITSVIGGVALLGVGVSNAIGAMFFNPERIITQLVSGEPWADERWDEETSDEHTGGDGFEQRVEPEARDGHDAVFSLPAEGIEGLNIEVAASQFTLEFADVEDAVLAVDGPDADRWVFGQEEDDLFVESPAQTTVRTHLETATLTLPQHLLETTAPDDLLDLDVELAAGQVILNGDFADADLTVQAGELRFDGAARSLDLDVQAGAATVTTADTDDVDIDVAAGRAVVTVTGAAPSSVDVDTDIGEAKVTLPRATYQVSIEADLGSVNNGLETSATSRHKVEVRTSVGSVTLSPAQ